ncbi:MAG: trypsin-like peptidase domain-containing protein [Treponema sp.]|nr:trypsin-like peptidase domain-containing protein [Treponema sp.]
MKLYSKPQLVVTALLSAGIVLAGSVLVQKFLFSEKRNSPDDSAGNISDNQAAVSTADSDIEEISGELTLLTNSPVLPVLNDASRYTQDEVQNITVYEKCNEAVVNITTQVMTYDWFYNPYMTDGGSGSGSIIDKRGYVLTNVHVIENARVINISLADGSSYEGKIIGQDKESDIAVLKFDPPSGVELKTISFGTTQDLKVGQKVIAIGNPFALERTMTTGIISGLGRPIQESNDVIIRNMIQTDAAINPGNSGGPLLDSSGNMIGINTVIISKSGSSSGLGFAVPISTARRVVSDLIKYGKVNRGTIKISLIQNTPRIAGYMKTKQTSGMVINRVEKGSLAEKAGLKGGTEAVQYGSAWNYKTIYLGGDIITAIGNISVSKLADYYSALEDKVPGDTVTVTVYRDGKFEKINVTLESQ